MNNALSHCLKLEIAKRNSAFFWLSYSPTVSNPFSFINKSLNSNLFFSTFTLVTSQDGLSFFKTTDFKTLSKEINLKIKFDRKFEKWDNIIQAIILISISEIRNSSKEKIKIILNDYIEISKSFVNINETKLINSILDKLINEK